MDTRVFRRILSGSPKVGIRGNSSCESQDSQLASRNCLATREDASPKLKLRAPRTCSEISAHARGKPQATMLQCTICPSLVLQNNREPEK